MLNRWINSAASRQLHGDPIPWKPQVACIEAVTKSKSATA